MRSLLYVDDEPGLLEIGKIFLEQGGQFSVETVTSATEALELLRTRRYDAIISDYQMPGIDGIEFLKRVRAAGNPVPFIIFTGRGREEIVIQAFNEGADFYLQKGGEPIPQFAELGHKVDKAILQRRAEASIRDHERREADIINFLPDATFAIDTRGVVIAWNRAMEKMTGVMAADVLGKANHEYALPFYHERRPLLIDIVLTSDPAVAKKYPFVREEGKTLFSEITIPHFNGGKGAVLWFTASPLYNRMGEMIGAIESIREITEWKRAEAALHDSEQRFRELADMLPLTIFEADDRTILTYANRAAFETFGYTDAVIRDGGSALAMIAPEDRERAVAAWQHVMAGTSHPYSTEYRALRNDGSTFPASIYSSPIFRDGKAAGVRGIVIDITAQKEAEARVAESERNYRLLFENATEGILVAQGDRLVHINPALVTFLQYPKEVILEKPFTDFIHPEDRELVMGRHLQRMRGESPPTGYQFRIIDGDGQVKWVWISSTRMTWSDQPATLSFLTDITDRKKAEDQLVAAGREYANLLEQIQDIYYRSDAGGRLVRASRSLANLLGYDDVMECIGRDIAGTFYLNPEDRRQILEAVTRDGSVKEYEVFLRKKDGTPVMVSTSSHVITDRNGAFAGVEGTFRDITERRQQERILRAQRDLGIALQATHGMQETLDTCLDAALSISGLDSGGIYLVDDRTGSVGLATSRNLAPAFVAAVSRFPAGSVNARIVAGDTPVFIPFDRIRDNLTPDETAEGLQAVALLPIRSGDRPIACMVISSHTLQEIPAASRVALETLAAQMGGAIERIRAEEALLESEQRYRNIVEDQTELICRFRADGIHVFVNDAYCRYFGLKREEIIGHRFQPDIPPEDRQRLRRFFASLTPEHPVDIIEHQIIMPDGSVRWQRWSDRAIFDDDGNVTEYQSVGQDTTDRKEAELTLRLKTEALDERNRLISTLLDTVPIGIFMVEAPSGRPVIANREATRLLGRGILPGATESTLAEVYEAFRGASCQRYPTEEMPVVRGLYGESCHIDDMVVVRPDGLNVQLEVFGTPVRDNQGRVTASLVSFLDITERKRAEQVIREAGRKINLLTSITRHDVGNQIAILRGFAKLALMKSPDPEVIGLLGKIEAAVSIIARQIEFTREYQELGMHAPGWQQVRGIVSNQEKREGIVLSCTCDEEVFADPMLERVFFNLIDNAARHGEKVTAVTVSCRRDPDSLVIVVADNGIGVPPELKEKIFSKGFGKNTGFGLFLAREILAITGITVRETGTYGNGAQFEIVVPKGMYRSGE